MDRIPNPDKPEPDWLLIIEDWIFVDVALLCHFYDLLLKLIRRRRTLNSQSSIDNIQSFGDGKNISIQFFWHQMQKNNF